MSFGFSLRLSTLRPRSQWGRRQRGWWRRLALVSSVCTLGMASGCASHPAEEPAAPWVTHAEDSKDSARQISLRGFDAPTPDTSLEDSLGYQITYVDLSTGRRIGTANERSSRAALSLVKLYIAHYVFTSGETDDQYKAMKMVADSDDTIAEELYAEYPDSISWAIEKYNLQSTVADWRWGYSLTTTYDVAYFLAQVIKENPLAPILVAMANSDDRAADGTMQNFGTSILPGAIGTKFAWSNDKDLHSTATFGTDFVAVASNYGDSDALTKLVRYQLLGQRPAAAASTSAPTSSQSATPLNTSEKTTPTIKTTPSAPAVASSASEPSETTTSAVFKK
ncbi:MAG: hypothetical protein Q4A31_08715 [Corynebacterium sp.]|uniref:hypothetical protein n=1 Tax=Corynebacterium sp. TaxID=1720 RepID=UPI0026DCB41B|nr:hypothetical protein [Corynebacterium sp.]MDO4761984.1 hypothetical protein [Corynebacterium sp.]